MRINKAQLEAIAALPDDKLWATVVNMAKSYGFSLPENTPSHEELEKLRGMVNSEKINVGEALKLLNNYRKGY